MQKIRKTGEGILLGGLVLLLFLAFLQGRMLVPDWLMVIGRMHPLFLHFPIVLLFISFLTVWLPERYQKDDLFILIRLVAALSAIFTAIMGLLLSTGSALEGSLLQWHKWSGIGIAIAGFIFYTWFESLTRTRFRARAFTVLATLLLLVAGDKGGSLTHGAGYLLGPDKILEAAYVPPEKAVVFANIIQPVLKTRCGSCHNDAVQKGGLLLLDTTGIQKGGKSGKLFVAGEPAISLLLQRIHLPEEDKKHMPPINKAQLTPEEIRLLSTWIQSGGMLNQPLVSLPVSDTFRILATNYLLERQKLIQPSYSFPAASESTISRLNNNYRVLVPLGKASPALSVSFYGKNAYTTQSLQELKAVREQVLSLNLSRMPVTDQDLSVISQFLNLEKLNLNFTDITSQGMGKLTGLKNLKELSLSGTAITAAGVDQLAGLPGLESLYIWDTKIDTLQMTALQKKYTKVHIESGFVDNGKFASVLTPPMLQSQEGVFDMSLMLKIKHPVKGAELRYTTDGTEPDSAKAKLYTDSFPITATTQFTVRAFKKGWTGSNAVKFSFIKRGYQPDSVELVTPADPKYKAPAKILTDADLGNVNFGNGKWLGYMNNDAIVNLYFHKPVSPHSVLINFLQRTEQFIFLPVQLEVWAGMSKGSLQLVKRLNPPLPIKNEPGTKEQFLVALPGNQLKVIRIMARPIHSLPQWHGGKGQKGWVFLNEIVLD